MTGNDIIDMAAAAAESNWQRKGFLEKIFTPPEQQYIREASCPQEMVWRLWSMKESAYKIYTRQYGGRSFAPLKLHCSLFSRSAGKVEINSTTYYITTCTGKKYIYSIAKQDGPGKATFVNYCFRIAETDLDKQQQLIYERMISVYSLVSGKQKEEIKIIKDRNGIPFLYCSRHEQSIPVSITHHGNYAAFTID
ncbi:MAG TPA: 4'-phosphopantetheinyl transferase superfamily protein [Ferruginibacter sp.]|nr:4'-phosphopantetheinyl transferase superfamily protein [Ferruginibacter sp.]